MSDNKSTNIDGDEDGDAQYIINALFDLCLSDELSITTLRETMKPLHPDNAQCDYKRDPEKTLFVFHHACMNKNVTVEIIEFLLNNSIICFSDAAQVLCTEFSPYQGDDWLSNKAYPLNIACYNEDCPSEVIRFLIELYPPALRQSRNRKVDIDTITMMIEAYPQSLQIMVTDEDDEEVPCYPIHALLSNESTDNLQDILAFVIELEGIYVHTLDLYDRTMLHLACENKNVTLELFKFIFNIWPEAIRLAGDSPRGCTPLKHLCSNHDSNQTTSLDILQYMIGIDPSLPMERDIGGYLPLHSAVSGMPIDFCKVLINAYPESVRIASNRGGLPVHNACSNGNRDASELIQYMLELYPESINSRDDEGRLPIHCVARHGRVDIIESLLKHDPDMVSKKTTDSKRQLPLHIACRYCKQPEAIQVLYDAFPEAALVFDADRKIPSLLVKKSRSKVLKFFRDQYDYVKILKDVDIMHSPDKNGWLPLHHALKNNVSLGTIKLLVDKALVSIRAADDKLAFPIHIACEFSSIQVVKFLVEYDGIPTSHLDLNKDSILHYACRGGNCEVVKYLITNHASLVSSAEVNGNGELPIHLLCEAGKDEVDCNSAKYIETIWLMLLSNPEAVMS